MLDLIRNVIRTLDRVEVKGRDNLDMLLGSINALEELAMAVEAVERGTTPAAPPSEEVTDG